MTDKNYDIIVIGAGCGGLSAAVCAAKEGKNVLLLERHNAPGGFMSSFVRGRFEFDISLQQLCGFSQNTEHGELRQLFDELNITKKIEWTQIPEAFRLISKSADGSEIDVIVDDFTDGVFVCRSEFESPEVDGEILVKYDSAAMGDVDPYSLIGEFMMVKVTAADEYDLTAEPLEIL